MWLTRPPRTFALCISGVLLLPACTHLTMVLKIGDGLLIGHTEPFPSSGVVRGSAPAEKTTKSHFCFVLQYSCTIYST